MEQSVVLIKPDGLARGLVGEIISRFEKAGLQLVAMKLVRIDETIAGKHYGVNDEWFENVGKKLKAFYEKVGLDKEEELAKLPNKEIGKLVQKWNIDYLTKGPVVAMLWQSPNAVAVIRKMVGSTFPEEAAPGTIRGDYSFDSPAISNVAKRSIYNLIHASGTAQEGQFERKLWFKEEEIFS